ncbi:collagen-like protein [bacterium]|nr:collagen-like protein [bacterium]
MRKLVFTILCFLSAMTLSAFDMLVRASSDDVPTNKCEYGGVKIEFGYDSNENGSLDDIEVIDEQTIYVCNGKDGDDGSAPVVSVTTYEGNNCANGGLQISIGDTTSYVCHGSDGKNALAKTSSANSSECLNGGVKIEIGIDDDRDGELDDSEVDETKYACNGPAGKDGDNALVNITDEPQGANCPKSTGVKIEIGIDKDGDGELTGDEISNTKYICNGKNGSQGAQGPKGDQGEPGVDGSDGKDGEQGEKGDQGPKGDQGEQGETGATGESGKNGMTSLVSVVDEPQGENCASGGRKIEIGLDENGNGALDEDEVDPENIYYVCNGRDAEEAGLTSSSSGCAMTSVDGSSDVVYAVFVMISMLLAAVVIRFANR